MNRGSAGRTQACSASDAEARQAHAEKFLEVAELVATETAIDPLSSVSAALAVLAGIAAADAACCKALGQRSRSQDHHDAEALVSQIIPGGKAAAQSLERLLNVKDTAHYGLINVSGQELRGSLRRAKALVDFSAETLRR